MKLICTVLKRQYVFHFKIESHKGLIDVVMHSIHNTGATHAVGLKQKQHI